MKRQRWILQSIWAAATMTVCLSACGDDVVAPTKAPPIMPLTVGNSWHYESGGVDSVVASVSINGQEYAELLGWTIGVGRSPVRMNELDQLVYWNGEREQVLYDFAAPVRSSWIITWGSGEYTTHFEITLVSKMTRLVTPAGEFENGHRFDVRGVDVLDADRMVVIVPGVGVVFMRGWAWGPRVLLKEFIPAR